MRDRIATIAFAFATSVVLVSPLDGKAAEGKTDHLRIVRAYADAMIERGRDTCGKTSSPLFAAALDRKTMKLGRFGGIAGIRGGDRTLAGANPMHDQKLYQILYALTEITGEKKYAVEADKALKWFFENCQSPATGLMAWGEHLGWDFNTERPAGNTHEFFRPWVLWGRCYKLAPEACARFARGVWDHQIGDRKTGNFSRHARYSSHGPGMNSQYPRHGGFYIATWAHAYQQTKDRVFLKAIETVLAHFDTRRNPKTGAIPCESASRSREKMIWPESNLSLAIDLWDGAQRVPAKLAGKMRRSASKTDQVYLRIKHDLSPAGRGFVSGASADTLEPFSSGSWTNTKTWATGYGKRTDAQNAMICHLRYRQTKSDSYRKLILAAAGRYLDSGPDLKSTIFPGPMGDAIFLMLAARKLTGQRQYLARAEHFAKIAVEAFLTDGSPVPRASSRHNHYEAITLGDTLMMSLLKLWAVRNKPKLPVRLVYSDR